MLARTLIAGTLCTTLYASMAISLNGEPGGQPLQASAVRSPSDSNGTVVSFRRDLLPLFQANCTICHQNSVPMGALTLLPTVAYANLVGANSAEVAMKRVAARDPDHSYLLPNIDGPTAPVAGNATPMPLGPPPFP